MRAEFVNLVSEIRNPNPSIARKLRRTVTSVCCLARRSVPALVQAATDRDERVLSCPQVGGCCVPNAPSAAPCLLR